ncbi:MAG: hypothetical protein M9885_04630 [Burkholderiaceae bacterium]|nr:hypothetical protein [Burkholderiaceae bacterium]
MKSITRFAIPTAFALAAFGVQAQTIETDYPAVKGNVGAPTIALPASPQAPRVADAGPELFLIQSNRQGPVEGPSTGRVEVETPAPMPPVGGTLLSGPGFNA